MQQYTIVVTDNNVAPIKQICVVQVDTNAEPPLDDTQSLNYDDMTAPDKAQFDACVAMIETYIVPVI